MIRKDSAYQPDVNTTRYLCQIGIDWARVGAGGGAGSHDCFLKNCPMNDYRREAGSLLGVNRLVSERL